MTHGLHECVGLDALRIELANANIGVSVLCPGSVGTNLHNTSEAVRQGMGGDKPPHPEIAGTEKPMEFAFINGVLGSRFFPPT